MSTAPLTISALGYRLIQQAELDLVANPTADPSIFVATFVVTTGNVSQRYVFADLPSPTGTIIYRGPVDSVHFLNEDLAEFTCYVPPSADGVGEIMQVALYTDQDELFALGMVAPSYILTTSNFTNPSREDASTSRSTYTKTQGYGLKIYAPIHSRNIGRHLSTQYSVGSTISKTIDYETLGTPDENEKPVVAVLNGHDAGRAEQGPTLLVKSSYDDSRARWFVVNGTLLWKGYADNDQSLTAITFKTQSFVPVGYDVTYVQIASGTGVNQLRAVTYDYINKTYEVDVPFDPIPDKTSQFELWASSGSCAGGSNMFCVRGQILPSPDSEIPPLADPDPLCEPVAVEELLSDPPIFSDPVFQASPTAYLWGVQVADFPICAPFSDNDTQNGAMESVKARLTSSFGAPGAKLFTDLFDVTQRGAALSAYVPAFRESNETYNMSWAVPPVITDLDSADNTVIHSESSDRMGNGNYQDMEITCSGAMGVINLSPTARSTVKTLDALLIPPNVRVIVYEQKNFTGRILADLVGPIYVYNAQRLVDNGQAASPSILTDWKKFSNKVVREPVGNSNEWSPVQLWMLDDVVWQGSIGEIVPRTVRFLSTDTLLRYDGSEQTTGILVEPNMSLWRGSIRVSHRDVS